MKQILCLLLCMLLLASLAVSVMATGEETLLPEEYTLTVSDEAASQENPLPASDDAAPGKPEGTWIWGIATFVIVAGVVGTLIYRKKIRK